MRRRPAVVSGRRQWGWDLTENRQEGIRGDGNSLYLDCGGGYTQVYVCQNSPNCTLKATVFYCTRNLIKLLSRWIEDLTRPVTKEDICVDNMRMKRCLASLVIKKMHSKMTMNSSLSLERLKCTWRTTDVTGMWTEGLLQTLAGEVHVKRYNYFKNSFMFSHRVKHVSIPWTREPADSYLPKKMKVDVRRKTFIGKFIAALFITAKS